MPKFPNISIVHIAYKKNRHLLVWEYLYILLRRYQHSLGPKNYTQKSAKFTKILNYTRSSSIIFLCETQQKLPLYILFTYYSDYLLLDQPYFVSLLISNPFTFDLANTISLNLILLSNLNFNNFKLFKLWKS